MGITNIIDVLGSSPLSLMSLVANLTIGLILSLIIRWHFKRFGSTLSNREEFSQVFPFILLTTVLIITVVKSSLALSLGLVGALSIVRFRTPIKEPEELAYLFISIAIGLGLGAEQTVPTIVAGILILAFMALLRWDWARREVSGKNLFLSVDMHFDQEKYTRDILEILNKIIRRYARDSELRRYDIRKDSMDATYLRIPVKLNTCSA